MILYSAVEFNVEKTVKLQDWSKYFISVNSSAIILFKCARRQFLRPICIKYCCQYSTSFSIVT